MSFVKGFEPSWFMQMQHRSTQQLTMTPKLTFLFGVVSAVAVVSLIGFVVLLARDGGSGGVTGGTVANTGTNPSPSAQAPSPDRGNAGAPAEINLAAITKDDHIRGSFDAPVKIVEYSDLECPFCKRHHPTMEQIIEDYGEDQVAWVYRHFPLSSIHAQAQKLAEATECAAAQGGNDAFWKLTDRIFEDDRPSSATVARLADEVGLDGDALQTCIDEGTYADAVQAQYQTAVDAGGQGTPYNVIVGPDGTTIPLAGAYPVDSFKQIIDSLLEN